MQTLNHSYRISNQTYSETNRICMIPMTRCLEQCGPQITHRPCLIKLTRNSTQCAQFQWTCLSNIANINHSLTMFNQTHSKFKKMFTSTMIRHLNQCEPQSIHSLCSIKVAQNSINCTWFKWPDLSNNARFKSLTPYL
jgi:hypothetical protein